MATQYTLPLDALRRIAATFGGVPQVVPDWEDVIHHVVQGYQILTQQIGEIGFAAYISGTGGTAQEVTLLYVYSGATANSKAMLYHMQQGLFRGGNRMNINWDKKIIIVSRVGVLTDVANGIGRIGLGKFSGDNYGDPNDKWIGWKTEDLALYGLIHDGTNLTKVNLGYSFVVNIVADLEIVSDGAGNIEWLVDGVSMATSALGPTGMSTVSHADYSLECTNGATAASYKVSIHSTKLYIEQ